MGSARKHSIFLSKFKALPVAMVVALGSPIALATPKAEKPAQVVDFARDVMPIFERACVSCHGPDQRKGGLRMHTATELRKAGISDELIIPGHSDDSYLMQRILGQGDEDRMPIESDPLSDEEVAILRAWINQGAIMPKEAPVVFAPAPAGIRRLTADQYRNAVVDLTGQTVDLALAHDNHAPGFANIGAYSVTTSERGVELYRAAAFEVAHKLFSDSQRRAGILGCTPRTVSDACSRGFLRTWAERLWRRPVKDNELHFYRQFVARVTRHKGDVLAGLEAGLAALLQSPSFLYVNEEPYLVSLNPERLKYTGNEIAAKLALFLWQSVPDAQLRQAAQSGQLDTAEGIHAEAQRMLASAKARRGAHSFVAELLHLGELDHLARDEKLYPGNTADLRAAMRQEVLLQFENVVFEDVDALSLFDSRQTFVNQTLASHYGLPGRFSEDKFTKVSLPADQPRAGILGTAAFLSLQAIATRPSPTLRGVFVRERLLCQEVPPPPDNVNGELPPADELPRPMTMRERLSEHATNATCANCHKFFDPIGLAMENFDALGVYRTQDIGETIDASGQIDGKAFGDAAELATRLRQHKRAGLCMTRNLFEFATGRKIAKQQEPLVTELHQRFSENGNRLQPLMLDIVTSDAFRFASMPKPDRRLTPEMQKKERERKLRKHRKRYKQLQRLAAASPKSGRDKR